MDEQQNIHSPQTIRAFYSACCNKCAVECNDRISQSL